MPAVKACTLMNVDKHSCAILQPRCRTYVYLKLFLVFFFVFGGLKYLTRVPLSFKVNNAMWLGIGTVLKNRFNTL